LRPGTGPAALRLGCVKRSALLITSPVALFSIRVKHGRIVGLSEPSDSLRGGSMITGHVNCRCGTSLSAYPGTTTGVRSKSELGLAEKFIALSLDYVYELPVNLSTRGNRFHVCGCRHAPSIGSTWR
jgi:hypothetical protein